MIEKILGYSILGTGIFSGVTYALKNQMEYAVKNEIYPDVDLNEIGTVSIQISTLNEERWVCFTLDSIIDQPLYKEHHEDRIELILLDSESKDNTVKYAEPYVDRVITTPRGLFTSRNIGAKRAKADIIVTIDAAQFYPVGWLNIILNHFSNLDVIAVTGSKISDPPAGIIHQIGNLWGSYFMNHIWGDNSVIRRDAWLESGGWNEDLDQQSFKETFQEEFDFYKRLEQIGTVVHDIQAVAYDKRTRFACNGELDELDQYCSAIREGQRF